MKNKNIKLALLGVLLFGLSIFSLNLSETIVTNENIHDNNITNHLISAGFWNLTGSPISIDDNNPSKNWSYTTSHYDWCSGSGSWADPYIIENVTINGQGSGNQIEISNSNANFIIRNCTLHNSISNFDTAAIALYLTNNGKIINNNCSDNDDNGILLWDSNNNTLSGNTVNNNGRNGIYSYYSNNNTLSENTINYNGRNGIYSYNSYINFFSGNNANNNNNRGIYLLYSDNNTLSGNTANNNDHGIALGNSNNNTLSGNTVNSNYHGIYFGTSNYNTLSENAANNNYYGIRLNYSNNNTLSENTANFNNYDGIHFEYSNNNTLTGNTASNNINYGIYFEDSNNNTLSGNIASNYNFRGIFLGTSNYNTLSENTANNNSWGLHLWYSNNNTLTGNTANNNNIGLNLDYSNNNMLSRNTANNNSWGLDLGFSNNTIILENKAGNNNVGIYLCSCSNNTLMGNRIRNNKYDGISIGGVIHSTYNLFFNNSFINNSIHAYDGGINNYWDNGTMGNYWDDYNGEDSNNDGIGDTPYNISGSANSQDNYPIWWDFIDISINTPNQNDFFGTIAPNFIISIDKGHACTTWYTIDNGLTNITFTGYTGTVDQTEWDKISSGFVTLTFYANNTLGVISSSQVVIGKDIANPIIVINSPKPNDLIGVITPSFNVEVIDANLDTIWYSIDGGITNTTFTENGTINQELWDTLSNGTAIITFYANDSAGNEAFNSVIVRVDKIIPSIVIHSPIENQLFGINVPSPMFNISVDDIFHDKMWYTLNQDSTKYFFVSPLDYINQIAWSALPDGSVKIIFYANDSAGNIGFAEVAIRKDINAPIISINNPQNNDIIGATSPSFDISIDELNLDKVWYSLNGGINITFTGLTGIINQALWNALPEGNVAIKFYVNDTLGKIGSAGITIKKDVVNPIITINNPQNNDLIGATAPSFNIFIDEPNLDKVWYSLNGGTNITFTGLAETVNQILWDTLPEGNITIRFYASDSAGNIGFQEVTVVKEITQPSPPGISGYNLLFLLGIISAVAIIIIKKRVNHLN